MTHDKTIASLSLDLDNLWSYLRIHGDPGWESFPTYLDAVVPRVLGFLSNRGLTITVFIVGKDASLDKNRNALSTIAASGHEIGNHSFHHDPWLHLYTHDQMEAEIKRATEVILEATGRTPIGFRGPGYSLSTAALRTLMDCGYLYDASTLPTLIGPLARLYYLSSTKLSKEERRRRATLFGGFKDGFRPLKPYQWTLDGAELMEIPVTTMPIFKVPIHFSYIIYLSAYSRFLALLYFRLALGLCRLTGTQPSLLLHPLDFLGCDDVSNLSFFPGMNLPSGKKIQVVGAMLGIFASHFKICTLEQHAREAAKSSDLRRIAPLF